MENTIKLLEEGLSQRLFHFCPLGSAYSILKTNSFKLTKIDKNPSDIRMNSLNGRPYEYYMCFSRTPYSGSGYVRMRRDKGNSMWKKCLVRFEIDGDMLNDNNKGYPVNYFTNKKDKKICHWNDPITGKRGQMVTSIGKNKTLGRNFIPYNVGHIDDEKRRRDSRKIDYNVIDRNQMSEYEDRLISDKKEIPNALKYIVRIDILFTTQVSNGVGKDSEDLMAELGEVIRLGQGKVHLFNSEKAFNSTNVRDVLSNPNNTKYGEIDINSFYNSHKEQLEREYDPNSLNENDLKNIAKYVAYLGIGERKETINFLIKSLGIENMGEDKYNFFISIVNDTLKHYTDPKMMQMMAVYIDKGIDSLYGEKRKFYNKLGYLKDYIINLDSDRIGAIYSLPTLKTKLIERYA